MKLAEIEQTFHFEYPTLYKQLEQDLMLDVGEYGSTWYSTVFPKIKDHPTLLLHSCDFELLSVDAVNQALEELRDPQDYRNIDPNFCFVPFAQSGAGDHYCFFFTEKTQKEIPIVFLWHDCNQVDYLANNLQDFIFRALLTDMSELDIENGASEEEFRANLSNTLTTHLRYLSPKQARILETFFAKEIKDYEVIAFKGRKELHKGLLDQNELKAILNDVIALDALGETFEYSTSH